LHGRYFSRRLKAEFITKVFNDTLGLKELHGLSFDLFYNMFQEPQKSEFLDAYDDSIHGPMFDKCMEVYKNGGADAPACKDIEVFGNIVASLFDRFPPEQQDYFISLFIKGLGGALDNKEARAYLWIFERMLDRVERPESIIALKKIFPAMLELIEAGKLDPTEGFVGLFLKKWLVFLPKIPFKDQCDVFAYVVGPFAPISRTIKGYMEDVVKKIITKDGKAEDRSLAYELGKYIAASKYLLFLTNMFGIELGRDAYEGVIEGFSDAVFGSNPNALENRDVKGFLRTAFYKYFSIFQREYIAYIPGYLKRKDVPQEMIGIVLSPARNQYLQSANRMLTEQVAVMFFTFDVLNMLISDKGLDAEKRKYAAACFEQVVEDIARLKKLSPEDIRSMQARIDSIRETMSRENIQPAGVRNLLGNLDI
jgi:hypothetical protein